MSLLAHGHFFDRDHFLDELFAPLGARRRDLGDVMFAPAVDIKEKKDHFEIVVELPGVEKEDIHLNLEDGILTLEAESRHRHDEKEDGKVIRQERRYGKIQRSFNLGADMSQGDISASFKDGLLKLKASKPAEAVPERRRIEVA